MFEWLDARIAEAQAEGWAFLLRPPASEEAVRACEAALGLPLPPSYRGFLLRWDGASLFRVGSDAPGDFVTAEIDVAGAARLPALNRELRAEAPADAVPPEEWGRLIVGGHAPGGGDHWGLNPEVAADGEYAVVDCHHESRPRCWLRAVMAPSFEAWLQRAFDAALATGDPYYWLNLPELQAIYRQCDEELRREAAGR